MAPPSYARATASSTSKASPKPPKVQATGPPRSTSPHSSKTLFVSGEPSPPSLTPGKSLKRPSLLTPQERDLIAYKRDLYAIKPKDPLKPCPLATLPSELRCHIYTFLLPTTRHILDGHKQHLSLPLLRVCRALRIEAAYTYYTATVFRFSVRNLDFEPVRKWVDGLSKEHRALLGKNKGLEINIVPRVVNKFTYPPPNFLVDGYLEEHWKACQQFGNIYTIRGDAHKKHFLIFCRLASWWTWCCLPRNKALRWNYTLDALPNSLHGVLLPMFLYEHVTVLTKPCVHKAWKRGGDVRSLRRAAIELLDALNKCYEEEYEKTDDGYMNVQGWDDLMDEIRRAVERW